MIIIKIGGGQSINIPNIAHDLALQKEQVIIVHGGNASMDYYGKKLEVEKKLLTSPTGLTSRYTTPEVINLMYLTYAGLMNKTIVQTLQKAGINAIGLSGIDGKLITGTKHPALLTVENGKKKIVTDDLTGSVKKINHIFLQSCMEQHITPVITPPVITEDGTVINVDGDKIAAKIATTLNASFVLFLIEAPGILQDIHDEKTLIRQANKSDLETLQTVVSGRMKRKILECMKLLDSGVNKIIIADGRIKNPISNALKGGGTHVVQS